MVKFIQTSDWQIGMKGSGLGEAGQIVRETRIETIHNVLQVAAKEGVDFVLLCGDIFEHNMVNIEEVKKVVRIFNQYPEVPLYLLPGNHDILGADCVYRRDIFKQLNHLTILDEKDPIELENATLHPCPILSKYTKHDLTESIPNVHDEEGIHIGVAHGSLVGKMPMSSWEDVELPIEQSCVERTGIDFLSLGHWHGYRIFEDEKGISRIAYSGTHEQTKYDEDAAGYCLYIQIDKKGDAPKIKPVQTGQLKWSSSEFEIKDYHSINELIKYFTSLKKYDLVRINLLGKLPLEYKDELENILDFQSTVFKNFRVKTESLIFIMPSELDAPFDFGDPTLNQVALYLKKSIESEPDQKKNKIMVEALSNLQSFVKEIEN